MTCLYQDLDSASNWLKQISVVARHQHGISVLVSQTSFCGETSGGVGKCRVFFSGYGCSIMVNKCVCCLEKRGGGGGGGVGNEPNNQRLKVTKLLQV